MSIKHIAVAAVLLAYMAAVLLWAWALMSQPIGYPQP